MVWAVLGMMLSYAALYLFTPFGLAIVVPALVVAVALPSLGASRLPEGVGLLAGPGLFCFPVAASADDPGAWIAAGAALVGASLSAYVLVGRACSAGSA